MFVLDKFYATSQNLEALKTGRSLSRLLEGLGIAYSSYEGRICLLNHTIRLTKHIFLTGERFQREAARCVGEVAEYLTGITSFVRQRTNRLGIRLRIEHEIVSEDVNVEFRLLRLSQ